VAPPGKQVLHTDIVVGMPRPPINFNRNGCSLLWDDLKEMFPGIESRK
jgi:hypothetical protein